MKVRLLIIIMVLLITPISYSQETTDSILNKAYEQADKEDKNVWVIFHASWCSWCKKMDQNLQDERINSLIEANYVVTHLTVNESKDKKHLETPASGFFLKRYNGAKAGLPFWLIFDKNGSLLANSYGSNGKNMGSPSSKKEVVDFKTTLKKTSKLSTEELELIGDVFYIKEK